MFLTSPIDPLTAENIEKAPAHSLTPWSIGDQWCITTPDPDYPGLTRCIGQAFYLAHEPHNWERAANARLIAAAPDLRQAGQTLYDAMQRYFAGKNSDEDMNELDDAMNDMEAAWHKADGTEPKRI